MPTNVKVILQDLQNYVSEECGRARTEFSFLKEIHFFIVFNIKQKNKEKSIWIRTDIQQRQRKNVIVSHIFVYLKQNILRF